MSFLLKSFRATVWRSSIKLHLGIRLSIIALMKEPTCSTSLLKIITTLFWTCRSQKETAWKLTKDTFDGQFFKPIKDIWIGYESPEKMASFFNSDGVSAAWNNFKITGETDGRTNTEHNCASLIENGKWKKNDCLKLKPFVCQKETRLEVKRILEALEAKCL